MKTADSSFFPTDPLHPAEFLRRIPQVELPSHLLSTIRPAALHGLAAANARRWTLRFGRWLHGA